MSYTQEVKDLARKIDPACWVSYSDAPGPFKQEVDARRSRSLRRALVELHDNPEHQEVERRAKLIAAVKMGLTQDFLGEGLPEDLWGQVVSEAIESLEAEGSVLLSAEEVPTVKLALEVLVDAAYATPEIQEKCRATLARLP